MARKPFLYDALAVTPSDAQPLVRPTTPGSGGVLQTNANVNFIGAGQTGSPKAELNCAEAVSCAVGGTMTYIDFLGNSQQVTLVAGFTYYMRITQVKNTGTAATGIVVYFPVYE